MKLVDFSRTAPRITTKYFIIKNLVCKVPSSRCKLNSLVIFLCSSVYFYVIGGSGEGCCMLGKSLLGPHIR